MNSTRTLSAVLLVLFAAVLSACASAVGRGGPELGAQSLRGGVITHIRPIELEGDHQLGAGAVLGALAGGILGHQIGGGSGQGLATVLGAVGGGFAGNAIQNRYADKRPGEQISVRLDGGGELLVTQPAYGELRVGDRVVIRGDGAEARVVRS